MKTTDYKNDELSFQIIASILVGEFNLLKKINDSVTIEVWNGYIPEATVVGEFWKYLARAMDQHVSERDHCKAVIGYSSVGEPTVANIYSTNITLTRITESASRKIEAENKERAVQ